MTTEDRRTRRLRELPRYTVVDGKDVDLEPHPEGDWVCWDELAAVLDTEGDRPQKPQDGLALTLENDFLAIGRLIQDGRADFERIADWAHRLIQALGRYFHDDKLIMFDREGLIRFIDNQPPAQLHNCVDHPLSDHEWICLTCLESKQEPSESIVDTEGDRQVGNEFREAVKALHDYGGVFSRSYTSKFCGADEVITSRKLVDLVARVMSLSGKWLRADTEGDRPESGTPCVCGHEKQAHRGRAEMERCWGADDTCDCLHFRIPDPPVQP